MSTQRRDRALRPPLAAILAGALALALTGCTYLLPNRQTRGILVDNIDYAQLVPGTTTRADAASLLGSPTAKATFDDNTWFYIGEITEPVVLSFPRIDRQQVVVLNFDQGGTLQAIHRYTGKDAVRVAMVQRTTPSPGSEASILQQVIGNVGRYNPAGLLGKSGSNPNGSAGGSGGAGNSLP